MEVLEILGLPIANVTMAETLDLYAKYKFVIPINVDVLLRVRRDEEFASLLTRYKQETLLLPDSQVLILAANLILGYRFKERVSGSDLLPKICEGQKKSDHGIYLLGGVDAAAEQAMEKINNQNGRNTVVGAHSPSWGFEKEPDECESLVRMINESGAETLAVGVGAPKQEKWMFRYSSSMPAVKTYVAVGATIDFMAGKIRRAPAWVSNIGLEWLYRLLREPKRLAKRYLVDDVPFFWLLIKQRLGHE